MNNVAPDRCQEIQAFLILYAFCDDLQPKVVGELDRGFHEQAVIPVAKAADKAAKEAAEAAAKVAEDAKKAAEDAAKAVKNGDATKTLEELLKGKGKGKG